MIKLSEYVIEFLVGLNVKHVFVIQGGAVAQLIDSLAKHNDINYITCQHEQACAMAADAYSRTSDSIGVAMATSGPGATNLITGISNAYYDSIPVLYITGNVASFRQSDNMGIRQYGFQETNIVDIVKPITKYSINLQQPEDIKYQLEKAIFEAFNGRKGPVLVDIPDDFQREMIDEEELRSFIPREEDQYKTKNIDFSMIQTLLDNSQRPILVYGSGIISADAINTARKLSRKFNIPTLYSWPLKGIFNYDDELNFGSFGTNAPRSGNFIIQNCDLILSIGNRLDTHATGTLKDFARAAKIISVDIDNNELEKFEKFGKHIDMKICADAKDFINGLDASINYNCNNKNWHEYCKKVKYQYKYKNVKLEDNSLVSPEYFLDKLSQITPKETIFIGDTGANLVYLFNGLKEKFGQKFLSAFNNTPMGFALPASIGSAFANKNKRIICCSGDGGLQMNIQELATIAYYRLPITIFVFNNSGHGMIKQTQDDWFESKYNASSHENGIPKLNFKDIANAYKIKSIRITNNEQIEPFLATMTFDQPMLVELILDEKLRINPMLQFGRPLEDMNPLLNREEFIENMIIDPLTVSKKR